MQKWWLKDFEIQVAQHTLEAAAELMQAGAVVSLKEIERHFWVAEVDSPTGVFETEMIITPNKIKAYTCTCFSQGRRLICPHLTASLFRLRQFLEQRPTDKAEGKHPPGTAEPRRSLHHLLENADPATLQEFIRHYARKNKDFSLALTAWLAATLDTTRNPYTALLTSVSQKTDLPSMREPDFRRFKKVIDELTDQLQQAHRAGKRPTTTTLASTLLDHLLPLTSTDTPRANRLDKPILTALTVLTETLNLPDSAPELQENIRNTLLHYAANHLPPNHLLLPLITPIFTHAPPDLLRRISDLYDLAPPDKQTAIATLYTLALAQAGKPEAAVKVLQSMDNDPDHQLFLLQTLENMHLLETAALGLQYGAGNRQFSARQRLDLHRQQMTLARKMGNTTLEIQLLKTHFLDTGDFSAYDRLKELTPTGWPSMQALLIHDLHANRDLDLLAAVYAADQNLHELGVLLENHPNWSLLHTYQPLLLPSNPELITAIYLNLLHAYLKDHFGRQATGFLFERLQPLLRDGHQSLARTIATQLIHQYPERSGMADDLDHLLHPTPRKPSRY